jgi:micrococcal nuclease
MTKRRVSLAVLVVASALCALGAKKAPTVYDGTRGRVLSVADGDTFTLAVGGDDKVTVRLRGVDCPESKENDKCARDGAQGRLGCAEQVPLGKRATKVARTVLAGQTVTLESGSDSVQIDGDMYGRVLAYIRLDDGRDLGQILLEQGLCEDFSFKYPHPRQVLYKSVAKPVR